MALFVLDVSTREAGSINKPVQNAVLGRRGRGYLDREIDREIRRLMKVML